ncbi:MAG: BrnT family toxin [Betaproteobacteria bacterium]|nr:BrnT family toxin [Betaproteobacteria bacterium]
MINFDLIVGFEWDSGNSRKNEFKHSVTPAEAEEVFFNHPLLIGTDDKHSESERRYLALGKTNQARALTVIFTLRQGATLIRVISVRDQHRKERQLYEQA